jgi:hypothetical protein
MMQLVQSTAANGGYTAIVPAVDYTITCEYGGQIVNVSGFNAYVERRIALPDETDPARITTGILVSPDGTAHHVPTRIIQENGKFYAIINSLTNSAYTVIWNPVEFSDMKGHWAREAVNDMGSRMIIASVGKNYEPNRSMTRAEFAAVLVRALGLEPGSGESGFRDIDAADWYSGAVQTATAYGLIRGYDNGSFGPNDTITREQAMTILARAMKLTGLNPALSESETGKWLEAYTDGTAVSAYAGDAVAACLKAGLVSGTGNNTLSPKADATRAELAVMVKRLLQKSGLI